MRSGSSRRARRTAASAPGRSWTRSARGAESSGGAFRYDRRCYRLSAAEIDARVAARAPSTIRFLLQDEEIAWDDAVHGRISFQGRDLDDFVILRSDNTAIYNLAVVSDDIAMAITHVIRGDDHISNTPKQIALYRALGHEPPVFAHVPMILGSDGKKLSKRHGATAVGDYQEQGIFPAAMRNFLALLGWSSRRRSRDHAGGGDGPALYAGRHSEEGRGLRHHQAGVDERAVPVGVASGGATRARPTSALTHGSE